jgi:microsomal dipeptidase-like Zn-dependent dipeptidase
LNRRQFLKTLGISTLALGYGGALAFAYAPRTDNRMDCLKGLRIIDAHAHPERYLSEGQHAEYSSTVKAMTEMGLAASVFAAVGDRVYLSGNRLPGTEYQNTMTQLDHWKNGVVKAGKAKLVRNVSDIPQAQAPGGVPGCILAIEGGDALAGNPERVDEFYRYGVRMITLIHFSNNELGDCMQNPSSLDARPRNKGLTAAGRRVVERMEELGMVVDVAHADSLTLRQIGEAARRPVVDSHGNPCSLADTRRCGRFRTWKDMEVVAETGGVVCTWTWGMTRGKAKRETFRDWAREIMEMKERIGMEHVGLGTDGGGGIPRFIQGYRDIRDLSELVKAMQEAGFTREEIAAYMGGNTYRVLKACMG